MFRCMHECAEIFTYMYAEITCVCVHIYMHGRRVYLCACISFTYMHTEFESVGRCLHICTLSLHVLVYISTYIHTETTCVWVYIYIYVHQVYRCVYADVCVRIFTYMYAKSTCVCIYLNICTRAYKCMHTCLFWYDTCLFLYMCVWVYICM